MRAGVFSGPAADRPVDELLTLVRESPLMSGADLAGEVSTPEAYLVPAIGERRLTVAAIDLGIKSMTPHRLAERGVDVHVLPAAATLEDVLAVSPGRGVLLQRPRRPGRGDRSRPAAPAGARARPAVLRDLLRQPAARPGAGPGHVQARLRPPRHQPARARPGHRPGRDHRAQPRLRRRRPLDGPVEAPVGGLGRVEVSHVGLNDDVVEGLRLLDRRAFSVQYHPEAAAGPHDAGYLFDRFVDVMRSEPGSAPPQSAPSHPSPTGGTA